MPVELALDSYLHSDTYVFQDIVDDMDDDVVMVLEESCEDTGHVLYVGELHPPHSCERVPDEVHGSTVFPVQFAYLVQHLRRQDISCHHFHPNDLLFHPPNVLLMSLFQSLQTKSMHIMQVQF